MLHDVDQQLEEIIRERGKIPKSDIDIAFDQPTGEWGASLSRPTLNVFCFDLRENLKLRRHGYEREVRPDNTARMNRLPSRMDLSYLVTAWARKIEDEHQLLWRALYALKGVPVIKPEDAVGALRNQQREIPLWVADMSIVDQRYNITDMWSVMDNQMRLGFLVVLTVELDLGLGYEAPLVLEGQFKVDQIVPEATPEEPPTPKRVKTTREAGAPSDEPGYVPDVRIVHRAEGEEGEDDNTR
jgi:hypothetical protein